MHYGFGDLVGNRFADDVEVGGDEAADEFSFEGFPLGEFVVALRGGRRLVIVSMAEIY